MPRVAFLFTPDHRGLLERRFEGGGFETLGRVEQAAYLHVSAEPPWWRRALVWALGPARTTRDVLPPFDEAGNDVLGLTESEVPPFRFDDEVGTIRRTSGRVVCLSPREPRDAVVLRDFWCGSAVRLCDGTHFALVTEEGEPIAIAFERAPLIIAPGFPRTLGEHAEDVEDDVPVRSVAALRAAGDGGLSGWATEIREGDRVEVVGLTWTRLEAARRFALHDRFPSYRQSRTVRFAMSDAPGIRMVVRRLVD